MAAINEDSKLDSTGTPQREDRFNGGAHRASGKQYVVYQYHLFTDNIKGTGVQQMLFIVDSKIITTEKTIDIELKNNYSGANSQYNMILPLSVIGNRLPTAPGKIPAAGLLELPEE